MNALRVPRFFVYGKSISQRYQDREPVRSKQGGMLVSGYAGKSQVKQNDLCLSSSEVTATVKQLKLP